jgi:hypothetical protein
MESDLYDVVAVNLKTNAERYLAHKLTKRNADGVVMMTVTRRGCDVEYYKIVRSTAVNRSA